MTDHQGGLALLLHTHMPYVEGFGTWPFGEEWLFEAVATVYLPLLELLEEAPVTVGLTPVLCDQLEVLRTEARPRFTSFLRDIRAPIHAEDAAGLDAAGESELAEEVRRAAGDYLWAEEAFERIDGDIVGAFARLAADGPVSIWTSSASHAVLPMLATDPGVLLQVSAGVHAAEHRFPGWEGGFWLPECAYRPGLERDLVEHGVRAFCIDQTDVWGLGASEHLEPVATEAGPVAMPLDWQTIKLVWDAESGYPVDPAYRNYHGRTIHDLRPWNNGGGAYRFEQGRALAREHARDFVQRVIARLDAHRNETGRAGIVCCALDTELLGHWWYEGLWWLEWLLAEARTQNLRMVTLPDALATMGPAGNGIEPVSRPLTESSWGFPKDLSTWDSPRVADIAFAARAAELRTVSAASHPGVRGQALERAARELLAVQASDWAFQVTRDLSGDYPHERVRGHIAALDAALSALTDSGAVPEPTLRNLAPELDLSPLVAP